MCEGASTVAAVNFLLSLQCPAFRAMLVTCPAMRYCWDDDNPCCNNSGQYSLGFRAAGCPGGACQRLLCGLCGYEPALAPPQDPAGVISNFTQGRVPPLGAALPVQLRLSRIRRWTKCLSQAKHAVFLTIRISEPLSTRLLAAITSQSATTFQAMQLSDMVHGAAFIQAFYGGTSTIILLWLLFKKASQHS